MNAFQQTDDYTPRPCSIIDSIFAVQPVLRVGPDDIKGEELQFSVDGLERANWVVKKILQARAYGERAKAWAFDEYQRAEKEEQFFLDRYGRQLEALLANELITRGGRARSLRLPAGKIGLRRRPDQLSTHDESALAAWCAQFLHAARKVTVVATGEEGKMLFEWANANLQYRCVDLEISKAKLREHFLRTGNVPHGMSLISFDPALYVA